MNNRPAGHRHFVRVALLAPMILLLALNLTTETARAQDPDFSTINDPLDGEYELYTVDDLVIARTKPENNSTRSAINNYILKTDNEAISSQSVLAADFPGCWLTSGRQPQQTRLGRFFNLPYDVIMTLLPYGATASGSECTAPSGQPNMALHIQSTENSANTPTPFTMSAANTAVAMADFNGDGFEDLFIMSETEALVATAQDVNNYNGGMQFGPVTTLPAATYATNHDPTSNDFNGDGLLDVIWMGQDYKVRFATVCPDSVSGTVCDGKQSLEVVLDPYSAGTTDITLGADGGDCYGNLGITQDVSALTAGRYTSPDIADLLTVDLVQTGTTNLDGDVFPVCAFQIHHYELDGTFAVQNKKTETLIDKPFNSSVFVTSFFAQSARLGWFADEEQAIIVAGTIDPAVRVYIVSFTGETMSIANMTASGGAACCPDYWVNGMAIGHFATLPDNPSSETDFNQQIAVLVNNGDVKIFGVKNPPTDVTPSLLSSTAVESSLELNLKTLPEYMNWLVAGDLQGRSARLGPPSIVRISQHMEPSVILGHPPMHADFILPDQSTATMTDTVNFSVVPNTYYSQYQTQIQNGNQSSHTHTTSHSYGYAESATEKFKVNVPLISSLSGSFTQAWQQQTTSVTANNNYSYSSKGFDSSTNTGFGDQIWFTTYAFNIYYYPVLGQTVCPMDQPDCSENEKEPLYVSYSGPSSIEPNSVSGSRAEWYQPIHEPGQIFSYPASYEQLKERYGDVLPLSDTAPTGFYTDDSTNKQFANWSDGSGTNVTTGSVHTHSFKTSNSITVGPPKLETLEGSGAQISGSFDYNSSSSASTLQVTQTSLGSSTGVGIVKPGSFRTPGLYEYRVQPFIFGLAQPAGTVQSIPLSATVQTTGPIHAAFTANPLDDEAGTWWQGSPYAQYIDIALNHPQRWAKTSASNVNIQGQLNCLQAGTSTVNCVSFNKPEPDDLWNSEFYQMRGLFVMVDGATGPQRGTAEVGDDVFLQARVYNYSLKNMESSSKVHLRFYRQEINGTTPVAGTNVLIEEKTLDPLPGFGSASGQNWSVATTSFAATADMADKYYIFWVVVWAEDGNGNLVSEVPDHGLSAIPGTLAAIGDVPLEQTTITDSNGDPETTSFSNNVGYLNRTFYIAPQQTSSARDGALSTAAGTLQVDNLEIVRSDNADGTIELEERLLLTADITAIGDATEGATVLFYEGGTSSASAYDMELIPHIRSDSSFPVSIPFRPTSCGTNVVVVVAHASADNRAEAITTFNVDCPPLYLPIIIQQDDGRNQ